jgi:hypothetical protein
MPTRESVLSCSHGVVTGGEGIAHRNGAPAFGSNVRVHRNRVSPKGIGLSDYVSQSARHPAVCSSCSRKNSITTSAYFCPCRSVRDTAVSQNPFSILYNLDTGCMDAKKQRPKRDDRCARSAVLRRKARKIVKLLGVEQSLKAIKKLPSNFVCGSLRSNVRSIYAPELTLVQELSIKTSAKAESQPCRYCENLQADKIDQWKTRRLKSAEVNSVQLNEFGSAFAKNVPNGWNKKKTPYIPNGHGTLYNARSDGGNWNREPFAPNARVELVHSSGKPRIVTLYSEHNVSVLTPLHNSLYASLKGREWLLVGSPTNEKLRYLCAGTEGQEWLSFDYIGATDNIKTAYVQRAVDILIDKGEGLSEDEVRCMRVLSQLSLGGVCAGTGQPMGSPMSFPVLCLINKTVVDLALTDLLINGEIEFKEWTRHRCLINGDDLLTMSTSKGDLAARVAERGHQVGMETNSDKTLVSPEYGEINSTVFKNCIRQKKTNVSSLWMSEDVNDVLGYADESCVTTKGFGMVALANVSRLARQKIKIVGPLSYARKSCVMSKKQLKTALFSSLSSKEPKMTNLFPVEAMPDGFRLTREETIEAIHCEVDRVREREWWKPLHKQKKACRDLRRKACVVTPEKRTRKGLYALLKAKKPEREQSVLSVLARFWENKRKKELLQEEEATKGFTFTSHSVLSPFTADLDALRKCRSKADVTVQLLKTFNTKRKGVRPIPSDPSGCPFSRGDGYVSLTDA